MLEEADAEAEMSQERSEEPVVRTRRRKGTRSKEKVNSVEVKTSPARSTGRKRGRAPKAKKEEEEEVEEEREEEEEEGKSKESEPGESNGDEDKEIVNATTKQSLPSLRSKGQSADLAISTPTKELMNSQPSPADSSKPDSPCETPEYFECPEQDCPRKYKHMKSLKHHLACAHQGIRRPSLKRKNVGTAEPNLDIEDMKTSDIVQSPPTKKTKSDSSTAGMQRHKSGAQRLTRVDYASGDSDKEGNEACEEGKNQAPDETKQVRRTGRRLAARKYQKQKDQSDEDQEDDRASGQETPPPPKKEIKHAQLHYLEDGYKGDSSASLLQPNISQTLGFGNNFTLVNGSSGRVMTSGSPVKGSLPAALKISNNRIHSSSGASGDASEAPSGRHIHHSSLIPALERMAVGQMTSTDTAMTAHLPTDRPQASSAKGDVGDTVGSSQHSAGRLLLSMEDKNSPKAVKKNRSSAVDASEKSPFMAENASSSATGAEFLARLSEAAAFGGRADNERMKSEQNSNDFHPPTAVPFVPNLDSLLQRNGSLLQRNGSFLGRGHAVGSSKDMPGSSSAPPRNHQPTPDVTAFSHTFPFLAGEAFGGFARFPGHPLAGFHYPMGLGGIPGFGNVDFSAALAAELSKARGGNA